MPGKTKKVLTKAERIAAERKRLSGPGTFEIQGGRGAFVHGRRYKRGDTVTLLEGEMAGRKWIRLESKKQPEVTRVPPPEPTKEAAGHQAMSDLQNPATRRPPGA